ncbi:MAG: hypothetical protein ACLFSQ_10170 [Candidatus Zixiibacteriota bacterium]
MRKEIFMPQESELLRASSEPLEALACLDMADIELYRSMMEQKKRKVDDKLMYIMF